MILGFNLKMNPLSEKGYASLINIHKSYLTQQEYENISRVILFSPFIYLKQGLEIVGKMKKLFIGAQNGFYEDSGSFTGGVSFLMLKNLGIKAVIIGHSECRKYYYDNLERINFKLKRALELDFEVYYCFGEKVKGESYKEVISNEFLCTLEGLKDILDKGEGRLYFVYEPWWSIGNKNNASPEHIKRVVGFIRRELRLKYDMNDSVCLYGGSVNSSNISSFAKIKLDGLLIGSASLDKEELRKIYGYFNTNI